jgi:hypothetical protein
MRSHSGQFAAGNAWTVIGCIAHDLTRWTRLIGLSGQTVRAARTLRRRRLQIPGRLIWHRPPMDRFTSQPAPPPARSPPHENHPNDNSAEACPTSTATD